MFLAEHFSLFKMYCDATHFMQICNSSLSMVLKMEANGILSVVAMFFPILQKYILEFP
jgi:hypothetical protein